MSNKTFAIKLPARTARSEDTDQRMRAAEKSLDDIRRSLLAINKLVPFNADGGGFELDDIYNVLPSVSQANEGQALLAMENGWDVDMPLQTFFQTSPAAATPATMADVKTTPGKLRGWQIYNTTGAIVYVQIFNTVSSKVTLGTTTPHRVILVRANANQIQNFGAPGLDMANGISIATTTGATTTPGAATGALVTNITYT